MFLEMFFRCRFKYPSGSWKRKVFLSRRLLTEILDVIFTAHFMITSCLIVSLNGRNILELWDVMSQFDLFIMGVLMVIFERKVSNSFLMFALYILMLKTFLRSSFIVYSWEFVFWVWEKEQRVKNIESLSAFTFWILRALVYIFCCKVVHTLVWCFSKCCDTSVRVL